MCSLVSLRCLICFCAGLSQLGSIWEVNNKHLELPFSALERHHLHRIDLFVQSGKTRRQGLPEYHILISSHCERVVLSEHQGTEVLRINF